jgi:murein DD-endopeptidase MepM/ murein hydrolase activator NlpD
VNLEGTRVPFDQLYHAGEDWFAIDQDGQVKGREGSGAPVHAIANGVVTGIQAVSRDGYAVIVEHHLPEGDQVWSIYWHVSGVQVAVGEAVTLGQCFAYIQNQGFNSHLHWEIRTFGDGRDLFPPNSAGGRGKCNGYMIGVGYTWDDDPVRAWPEAWGYLNPVAFVEAR